MSKVYLPSITSSNCIVTKDKDTIRVYDNLPQFDSYESYTDYYINSHYISKTGQDFITEVPACETHDNFTTEYYYRNDFADICIIFLVFSLIVVYLPYKIISRAFGRWLKL